MHPQFSCRLALIAVVLPQHSSDECPPEFPNGLGVENPAAEHLVYQCVEFASHEFTFPEIRRRNDGEETTLAGRRGQVPKCCATGSLAAAFSTIAPESGIDNGVRQT